MAELATRTTLTIQDCMTAVMGSVRKVAKEDRNEAQHFSFRGVDAVVNAVAPALREHGVIVTPHETKVTYEPLVTTKGANMMCSRVLVTYRFTGPGGDFMEAQVAGEAFDAGDKGTAKAMSVAFRIALLQALALPTDDTDPDSESYERGTDEVPSHRAAPGESTANANSVPSADAKSGQAASDDVASPSHSVTDHHGPDTERAPAGEEALGEGVTTPAGAPNYLSKDDQGLLKAEYGGQVAALKAYKARFGERITRLADITYEMRDEMEGANA